jgi:type IV secretory pathway TraG/TraD family ATPase VirD4
VVASVEDRQVRYFWDVEYPAMNYRTSADGVAPIANKLGAFLAHPLVRRALCNPEQPIDFAELLRTGRSLIVNLGKGRLGADTANVVGGLIVSAFALAAYQRQEMPPEQRTPYFLYVDEFHSFTTSAFADMLSELRKYGLGLIATTQHTSRLSKEVREAVFGNVGTLIAFRLGATDAEFVSKQFGADIPSPRDLVNLPNYEMYVKMMVDGVQTRPFSARTLPPEMPIPHAA